MFTSVSTHCPEVATDQRARPLLITALLLLGCAAAYGQQAVMDTLATRQLQEVVVKAPRVVRKADCDVYYPSQSAVDYSKDGVQLIRNLQIPTLMVNDVMESMRVGG